MYTSQVLSSYKYFIKLYLAVRESEWGTILLNVVVGLTGDSDTGNPTANASAQPCGSVCV